MSVPAKSILWTRWEFFVALSETGIPYAERCHMTPDQLLQSVVKRFLERGDGKIPECLGDLIDYLLRVSSYWVEWKSITITPPGEESESETLCEWIYHLLGGEECITTHPTLKEMYLKWCWYSSEWECLFKFAAKLRAPELRVPELTNSDVLELWRLANETGSSLMDMRNNAIQRQLGYVAKEYDSFPGNMSSRGTDGNTLGHYAVQHQGLPSTLLFILWIKDPRVPVDIKEAQDAEGRRIPHLLCMGNYPLAPSLLKVYVEGLRQLTPGHEVS